MRAVPSLHTPWDFREALAVVSSQWQCVGTEWRAGEPGSALRLLLGPLGYWRAPVAGPWTRAMMGRNRVLDVGSPKAFALHLAARTSAEVWATDLSDPSLKERWASRYARRWPGRDHFHTEWADGRRLPHGDGFFDAAFAISSLEHIPGDGDTVALLEIHRVLEPGGVLLLELPFRAHPKEVLLKNHALNEEGRGNPGKLTFAGRQYDRGSLQSRLLQQTSFVEKQRIYLGERLPGLCFWEGREGAWTVPLRPLDLPLALLNLRRSSPERAASVILVLEKPRS